MVIKQLTVMHITTHKMCILKICTFSSITLIASEIIQKQQYRI